MALTEVETGRAELINHARNLVGVIVFESRIRHQTLLSSNTYKDFGGKIGGNFGDQNRDMKTYQQLTAGFRVP